MLTSNNFTLKRFLKEAAESNSPKLAETSQQYIELLNEDIKDLSIDFQGGDFPITRSIVGDEVLPWAYEYFNRLPTIVQRQYGKLAFGRHVLDLAVSKIKNNAKEAALSEEGDPIVYPISVRGEKNTYTTYIAGDLPVATLKKVEATEKSNAALSGHSISAKWVLINSAAAKRSRELAAEMKRSNNRNVKKGTCQVKRSKKSGATARG